MGSDIFPEVAERWDKSADAKTYTFYLRKGVKFHRGYGELTAEEVKANWVRIQDPKTASRFMTDLDGATFEVLDPYTLRVNFQKPYPAFIEASAAYAAGLFLSPRALQELGDKWKTSPVGTGPFQWGKSEPGSSLTLDRFPDYWGTRPKVDQIYNKLKIDTRAAVLAVSTGELDAVYIDDPDLAQQVSKNPPPNTVFKPAQQGQSPYWLAFNLKKPPFDDIRVRHALRYAIDTESIARDLFGGLASPLSSFLPPFMWGYSDNVTKFPYDPARAKQLLADAKVPANWAPVMLGQGTSNNARIIHEAVGSFWNAVGVQVKVDLPDGGVFAQRRASGDYDVFGTGSGRIEPDQIATPYWRSGSTVNNAFYSGADDLIDQARAEPDRAKRAQLYADLQAKVAEDSPAAFIVATSSHLLLNKRVFGVVGPSWLSRIDWFNVDVPAE
jgi:peptide/nickel transport system substrate-binding protein